MGWLKEDVGNATGTLHVYSDVGGSNLVGNQVTDLLREVKYERKGQGSITSSSKSLRHKSAKRMETSSCLGKEIHCKIDLTRRMGRFKRNAMCQRHQKEHCSGAETRIETRCEKKSPRVLDGRSNQTS
ncbi:hypothetical protein OS493_023680 [Desmophyllum pertusum]|uniref:Uncharacterized protein n=1 Tax=Desmophyllum pertusum TaxID=174260 RepID=A0A9W9YYC4_9CNID|nr:hypothetical protein OS493_023680 [Desmophyllum pertusum]